MLLITTDGDGPLYTQIYRAVRRRILSGELTAGARLPASRTLASDLGTSRNVVVLAYEQLISEGYALSRTGSGTYVATTLPELTFTVGDDASASPCQDPARSVSPVSSPPRLSAYGRRALAVRGDARGDGVQRPTIDFRYGRVEPEQRGLQVWRKLVSRRARTTSLDYMAPEGDPRLRAAIAEYLQRSRGVRCHAEQVIVVSGSQQALDLAARVLLSEGDKVLIEDPQYLGARLAFMASGAELLAGPVDAEGLNLQATVGAEDARLVYVTPSHQFPTGAVMSLTRRLGLLEWAERVGAYVLEDDYDSEFRYQGRPIEAVQGLDAYQRTIYLGTFSKVLFPALRLGYLVLPTPLVDCFRAAKWLCDRHTSALEQGALADFLAEGYFEQHLRRMRASNARRRVALLGALEQFLGSRVEVVGTNAGLHVVAWFRGYSRQTVSGLIAAAAERGVGVYEVAPLYLEPPASGGLLLGYASLSERSIVEGVRRLGQVVDACDARQRNSV